MSKIITVTVEALIFMSLIVVIYTSQADAVANLSGTAKIIVGLITMFVAIGFILLLMKQLGVNTGK